MKRCKITILKTTLDEELAKEYAAPGFTRCPMMREGQVFYADYAKPEGFCDGAWRTIHPYVFALANGAKHFYFNDWVVCRVLQLHAATTVCVPSFSNWKQPTRRLNPHLFQNKRKSIRQ